MSIRPIRPIRRAVACSGQARCRLLTLGLRLDHKLSLELTMSSTVPWTGASLHLYPGTSCLHLFSVDPYGRKGLEMRTRSGSKDPS
jgi:hypothetical protein